MIGKARNAFLSLSVLAISTAAHAASTSDARVLQRATAARDGEMLLLQQIVNIDSETGDRAGAGKVLAVLAPLLQASGGTVRTVRAERADLGDNLVAQFDGAGRSRILIVAHVDTVFPAGTVARRPFRVDSQRAYGPGVSDEKGGVVEAVNALRILHDLGFRNYKRITLLLETSEEQGSPGTRHLLQTLLDAHDVELNMEPGDEPDAVTVWRKGSANIRITVHGRAAHAGIAPQDGRNAAVELMHQLQTASRFPQSGEGLTVNITTLKAGDRNNVIPDLATADVNYRVRSVDQIAPVADAFKAAATHVVVPDTSVEIATTPAYPPLSRNPATDELAVRARSIYNEIGRSLGAGGNGGASESALAAQAGLPALDGLGPVGGGFHSAAEFLDLSTVTPRLYLLTRIIMDLGTNPVRRVEYKGDGPAIATGHQ